MQIQTLFFDLEKFIEYSVSAVILVSSYPCLGPLPRTKISFFLLSICSDELLSAQKIITFLPQSKFGSEKSERESNPIPCPDEEHLSRSPFLIN